MPRTAQKPLADRDANRRPRPATRLRRGPPARGVRPPRSRRSARTIQTSPTREQHRHRLRDDRQSDRRGALLPPGVRHRDRDAGARPSVRRHESQETCTISARPADGRQSCRRHHRRWQPGWKRPRLVPRHRASRRRRQEAGRDAERAEEIRRRWHLARWAGRPADRDSHDGPALGRSGGGNARDSGPGPTPPPAGPIGDSNRPRSPLRPLEARQTRSAPCQPRPQVPPHPPSPRGGGPESAATPRWSRRSSAPPSGSGDARLRTAGSARADLLLYAAPSEPRPRLSTAGIRAIACARPCSPNPGQSRRRLRTYSPIGSAVSAPATGESSFGARMDLLHEERFTVR